jgi:hypothetical protein
MAEHIEERVACREENRCVHNFGSKPKEMNQLGDLDVNGGKYYNKFWQEPMV